MKSILVIEDEPQIRASLHEMLTLSKFQTVVAPNGLVGVDIAQSMLPDLIICDVAMPELNGYDVIRILRNDITTANIPFIFLTAQAERVEQRQGMELGAADYLTKPFKQDELLRVINLQLTKRESFDREANNRLNLLRSNISLSLPLELHTPISGIVNSAEQLIRDHEFLSREVQLDLANKIYTAGQSLYRLTSNFLLYSDLESRALSPDLDQIIQINRHQRSSSQRVLTQTAERLAKQYDRKSDLRLEIQNHLLPISEQKLAKVMEELLDNAFKFSPKSSPIYVIARHVGDVYHIDVIDMGAGMTPEQITNLGAYMQFDRDRHEQQGSGLGFIIAQRIIELYGGEVTVRSIPNQETIVNIALPIKF